MALQHYNCKSKDGAVYFWAYWEWIGSGFDPSVGLQGGRFVRHGIAWTTACSSKADGHAWNGYWLGFCFGLGILDTGSGAHCF